MIKNSSWQEAEQLAIYRRGYGELGSLIKFNLWTASYGIVLSIGAPIYL